MYFPILKSKQSEFKALGSLTATVKQSLAPIVDIVPNRNDSRTFGQHLDKICENVEQHWGTDAPIFIDLFDIHPSQRTETGEHPLIYLFRTLDSRGIRAIPTCGLDRDGDYVASVKRVIQDSGSHVLVRLLREDLQAPSIAIPSLQQLLNLIGVDRGNVSILFDLREIQEPIEKLVKQLLTFLKKLEEIGDWHEYIIAGSAMPRSVSSSIAQSSQGYIQRLEEEIWKLVNSGFGGEIKFGDYTIVNPEYVDLDPRIYANTMGPSIRYTTDSSWFVLRGASFSRHPEGYGQYHRLAQDVVSSAEFMGKNFSFGDEYISERASAKVGPGNPGTWITAGASHHMTFITSQILTS